MGVWVCGCTFSECTGQVLPAVHDVIEEQQRLLPDAHVLTAQLTVLRREGMAHLLPAPHTHASTHQLWEGSVAIGQTGLARVVERQRRRYPWGGHHVSVAMDTEVKRSYTLRITGRG